MVVTIFATSSVLFVHDLSVKHSNKINRYLRLLGQSIAALMQDKPAILAKPACLSSPRQPFITSIVTPRLPRNYT